MGAAKCDGEWSHMRLLSRQLNTALNWRRGWRRINVPVLPIKAIMHIMHIMHIMGAASVSNHPRLTLARSRLDMRRVKSCLE
jgi:hypothetical protein